MPVVAEALTIVVRLAGGIGNQLFMAAAATSFNELQGGTAVILYQTRALSAYSQKRESAVEILLDGETIEQVGGLYGIAMKSRLSKWISIGVFITERNFFTAKRRNLAILDDYFQRGEFFRTGWGLIRSMIAEKAKTRWQGVWNVENNVKIGVHIRLGDYLKPKNAVVYCSLGYDYYGWAIQTILTRFPNLNGKDICIFCEEQVPIDLQTLFPDATYIQKLQLSDIDEFLLLSLMDHHVIANSTFSFLAAIVHEGGCRIGPKNAYKNPSKNIHWHNLLECFEFQTFKN